MKATTILLPLAVLLIVVLAFQLGRVTSEEGKVARTVEPPSEPRTPPDDESALKLKTGTREEIVARIKTRVERSRTARKSRTLGIPREVDGELRLDGFEIAGMMAPPENTASQECDLEIARKVSVELKSMGFTDLPKPLSLDLDDFRVTPDSKIRVFVGFPIVDGSRVKPPLTVRKIRGGRAFIRDLNSVSYKGFSPKEQVMEEDVDEVDDQMNELLEEAEKTGPIQWPSILRWTDENWEEPLICAAPIQFIVLTGTTRTANDSKHQNH